MNAIGSVYKQGKLNYLIYKPTPMYLDTTSMIYLGGVVGEALQNVIFNFGCIPNNNPPFIEIVFQIILCNTFWKWSFIWKLLTIENIINVLVSVAMIHNLAAVTYTVWIHSCCNFNKQNSKAEVQVINNNNKIGKY